MVDYTKILMPEIWAESGDIVAPDSQKIKDGWAVEAVPRQWWNWMQNRVDNNVAYMLQKGIPEWDASTQYIANKSYVQRAGIVYKAILTSTNQDPVSATTYWVKAFPESTAALEALRGLTPAADTMPYFTGATTAATTAITAFARTLLDDPDAATMRSTLSVQIANANLTGLSGVSAGSNLLPYFTNVDGTMATSTLTAFARTLLDDGDAATMRATLGLGTVATRDVMTSTSDATANRIMYNGAWGLGGNITGNQVVDCNVVGPSGFYAIGSGTLNLPPLAPSGSILQHMPYIDGATAYQVVYTRGTPSRMYVRSMSSSVWGSWIEVQTAANGASTAEAKAGTDDTKWMSPLKSLQAQQQFGIGTKSNITDSLITALQPAANVLATGIYAYNIGATNAPNGTQAGVVIHVERAGSNASAPYGAFQMAMHGDGITYTSQRDNNTGTWSAWAGTTTLASAVAKSGDTMNGVLRLTGNSGIASNTSDGADNSAVSISGGGGPFTSRGAVVNLFGNEHSTNPGQLNMYAGDTGFISLSTGGTTRLQVLQNGRILINGAGDSGNPVSVNGNIYTNANFVTPGTLIGTAGSGLGLLNDTDTKFTRLYGGSTATSGAFIEAYGANHATRAGELAIGGTYSTSGASTIKFYSQQTQRMQLLANGRLLIGTGVDNGAGLLQVNGTISVPGGSVDASNNVTAASGYTIMQANTISVRSNDPSNAGNVHLWFYNYNGSERGLIYWSNDGSMHIRTGSTGTIMDFSNAGCTASGFLRGSQLYAGNALYQNDGNVSGTVWGGYLSNYLANTFVQYGNIQQTYANGSTVAAIGAYTSAQNQSGVTLGQGQLVAGSQLKYSSHNAAGNFINVGTWRCMGECNNGGVATFLRVS